MKVLFPDEGGKRMKRSSYFNGLLLVITALIMAQAVQALPFQQLDRASSSQMDSQDQHIRWPRSTRDIDDHLLKFLMSFGYLPQSDLETGNLRTEDQVRDAIKTMQAFAHIPVSGVVDEATRELMKRPRCGLPDIISDSYRAKRSIGDHEEQQHRRRHWTSRSTTRNKRYTVQGQRWHYTNLTWSLRKGAKSKEMEEGTIRYQVQRALNLWQAASRLTFTEVNRDDADIRISFHSGYHNDGYPFDGKGTLLAHAFFPGTGIGGDAHFDDEEPWVPDETKQSSDLSFFAVATHEFGHSLGLSHSSVAGAIMYPYYQSVNEDFKLHSDDITGIQAIYGSRHEGRVTNPALQTTTTTTTTTRSPRIPGKPETPTKTPTKKPIYPSKPHPRPPHGGRKPNTCDTTYDAISIIRRELFIFKDRFFWRIGPSGLEANYPVEIDRFWNKLPFNLTHIDAIYEKPSGQREMVIFIGKQYWIYPNNEQGLGPYPLTNLGLPEDLEKLDAALVWGHNGKTYFFSGTMYWRFDEETGKVELDYPRDMSMWKGVPYNIDAVFQHTNGKTYFFKGKVFWEFNDRRMKVTSTTPSLSAPFWMSCPTGMQTIEEDVNAGPGEGRHQVDIIASSNSVSTAGLPWCLLSCLLLWWFIDDSW